MVHSLLISNYILLSNTEKHLSPAGKTVFFNPATFLVDMEKAIERLKKMLADGTAYEKRIPDSASLLSEFIF
jgi:hypothetical protein